MIRQVVTSMVAAAAILSLAGCAGFGPSKPSLDPSAARSQACEQAVTELIAAVERVVSVYDNPAAATPSPGSGKSPAATSEDLATAVTNSRTKIAENGCPTGAIAKELGDRLKAIQPKSAIGKAVLARVTATLTGRSQQQAGKRQVRVTDNLPQVVAESPAGAVLELAPGNYQLAESLVLLDGITIKGSGIDSTILRSNSGDAAVVVVTAGRVELSDLALTLDPKKPSTGILAGPLSNLVLNRIAVSGATATADGIGGAGVQMSGRGTEGSGRGTTLEVTDSKFFANSWSGIAVGGGHQVSILRATVSDNGQCGICFLETSGGSVSESTFKGNTVALGATGTANPIWVSLTITGGVVGLQLDLQSAPTIQGVTINGASRAAVIFSGQSGGVITKTSCVRVPYGIVVADTAFPTLGDNSCAVVRGG